MSLRTSKTQLNATLLRRVLSITMLLSCTPAALHRRTLPCACSAHDALHLTVWQVGQWRHASSPLSVPENETPSHGSCLCEAKESPAYQEVRGRLTLKASDDHCKAVRTVCSIRHGVLTVSIESSKAVVAEVPVEALAVGLSRWRTDMFTIATLHNNRIYDEIYCFVDDQVKRNKWIAVFRRMDVAVFDVTA